MPETMNKPQLILVGGGGHCRSCIDVIEQEDRFTIAGIVEWKDHSGTNPVLGYPILGTDRNLIKLKRKYAYALVTVGQITSPKNRIRLYKMLKDLKFSLPIIVSPNAYVSRHAYIKEGTIVMHHALINAGVTVGKNCIINTKTLVEHDAVVEDHCHISTGAIVNGGVTIGSGSFFGSGAVSKEYISIGSKSFIKANSLITKSDE